MALIPGGTFKTEEVEESTSFEPVPAGDYAVMIIDSAVADNKAGTGQFLKLSFKIVDNSRYENRTIWHYLNLVNPNETAVSIAQRDLKAICDAINIQDLEDSNELHGIPLTATITVRPASGEFAASNNIGKFRPLE